MSGRESIPVFHHVHAPRRNVLEPPRLHRFGQCRTFSVSRVARQGCSEAVWKAPVTGQIFARRLNLDGDGQGDLRDPRSAAHPEKGF